MVAPYLVFNGRCSTFHGAIMNKFGIHWNIVAEEVPN